MKKKDDGVEERKKVESHPTMCLHCHLIVIMWHYKDEDPVTGSWKCPRCGHIYPFKHWKIRKAVRQSAAFKAAKEGAA